jgi:hypothetical protein
MQPPRSKKQRQPSKPFTGQLAEPIKEKWQPPKFSAEGRALVAPTAGQIEQLRKLDALAEHYGAVSGDGKINWWFLALRLARDFVPGFQIETVGAPPEARGKRPRGQPTSPDVKARDLNMLVVREILQRSGRVVDDVDVAEIFAGPEVDFLDAKEGRPKRSKHSREFEIRKKTKTFRTRLSLLARKVREARKAHPDSIAFEDPLVVSRWVDLIAEEGKTPEQALEIIAREISTFREMSAKHLAEEQKSDPE